MLAQSETGAVAFPPQLAARSISYLATEKLIFANCFLIRVVLDSLVAHHDTMMYPRMYGLMSFED